MENKKTAIVLEGGGMRGAYTAGALSWLIDNNITSDNAYGISTGAVHLSNYLIKSKDLLLGLSTNYITDPRVVGIKPLLRCGRIVDYDFLFDKFLPSLGYDISSLKTEKTDGYIGVYDMSVSKTVYISIHDMMYEEMKAATSLPILGKVVKIGKRELLDGGITKMIPIEQAVEDGCNANLVISTKPAGYVRKPAKSIVVWFMRMFYHHCPRISEDYRVRHINFEKQINMIKDLEKEKKAIYIYPTKTSNVTRLGGSREELEELYELGRHDMEARKEEIFELFGINA